MLEATLKFGFGVTHKTREIHIRFLYENTVVEYLKLRCLSEIIKGLKFKHTQHLDTLPVTQQKTHQL